jgi:hypothetical protein
VADLKNLHLIGAEELGQLVRLISSNTLTETRAKGIVVREAGRLTATQHSQFLEQRVMDPKEAVIVKADSLESLHQMNAIELLRKVAPAIDRSGSLRLKNQLRRLL